jgi:hypothetical protein
MNYIIHLQQEYLKIEKCCDLSNQMKVLEPTARLRDSLSAKHVHTEQHKVINTYTVLLKGFGGKLTVNF